MIAHLHRYIQTTSAISRAGGYRLAPQLEMLVPALVEQAGLRSADAETLEACLQALDACVTGCPRGMQNHMSTVRDEALRLLSHDPNYAVDEDVDERDDIDSVHNMESSDEDEDDE